MTADFTIGLIAGAIIGVMLCFVIDYMHPPLCRWCKRATRQG